MMRKLIYSFLLFSSIAPFTQAQTDKIMPHGGFTYQFISLRSRNTGAVGLASFYGLSAGINYVALQSNDQVSLGIDPNVHFSLGFTSNGTQILLQTPVYLLGRLGAKSTKYNEQKFGIGLGAGGNFTFISQSDGFNTFRQTFIAPSAVFEVNLRTRSSDYCFRVNVTPYKTTTKVDGDDLYFNNFGLSVLYSF